MLPAFSEDHINPEYDEGQQHTDNNEVLRDRVSQTNNQLQMYGLSPLSFDFNDPSTFYSILNTIQELLLQHQKDMSLREEAMDSLRRQKSDADVVNKRFKKVQTQLDASQRELTALQTKSQTTEAAHKKTLQKLQAEAKDLNSKNQQLEFKFSHHQHLIKRKEKELEIMREKYEKLSKEKDPAILERNGGIMRVQVLSQCIPPTSRSLRIRDASQAVLQVNHEIEESHRLEVEDLRADVCEAKDLLCSFNAAFCSLVKKFTTNILSEPEPNMDIYNLPSQLTRGELEEFFQSNLTLLKNVIAQQMEENMENSSTNNEPSLANYTTANGPPDSTLFTSESVPHILSALENAQQSVVDVASNCANNSIDTRQFELPLQQITKIREALQTYLNAN